MNSLNSDGTLKPGTLLAGRYTIQSVISNGGMSVVYDAKDDSTQTRVAIKMMHNNLMSSRESVARFRQEAAATSSLSHANLVRVHDTGLTEQGQPYLVMDYLEGINLQQFLDSVPQNSKSKTLIQVFCQVCDALQEAHSKGIIHRDLKPSNIMLVTNERGEPTVKLVDFGIAILISSTLGHQPKSATTFGTPAFMSPEQCTGKDMDARSDIYSLGCVMYQSFSGTQVFNGDSVYEVFYRHICEIPSRVPFEQIRSSIAPELEHVIFQCLEKDPTNRPESAKVVKEQLMLALRNYA